MESVYKRNTLNIKKQLDRISPTICIAKWLWVSLHLPQGLTQSCYHPKAHKIPIEELKDNITALHNTELKKSYRKMMLDGKRPNECSYCWKIEDQKGDHLSDRYYRSGERWGRDLLKDITSKSYKYNFNPTYVEVNFNQACNFKCCYCSPHLSTTWEKEIEEHGEYKLLNKKNHNSLYWLNKAGIMPIKGENPYIKAFWEWWPDLYKTLRSFRMTGGEPLLDHNTYKILDYITKKPNKNLEISITSNLCPPSQKTWIKFIDTVKKLIEANWKIICVYRSIKLKTNVNCAIINGKHYFITDDKDILDKEFLREIYNGKMNTTSYKNSLKIKFDGIINYKEFLAKYPIKDFKDLSNSDKPKVFGEVQLYNIYNTYENYIINKDFYRDKQLIDLDIFQYKNITINECKFLGFKFDDEDHWFNQKSENINNHYTFSYDITAPSIEHLMLFVSIDSIDEQLEYSRFGSNYKTILNNVKEFIAIKNVISISFINTFNILSIPKLKQYLQLILNLRKEFNNERQKLWIDFPILETPPPI